MPFNMSMKVLSDGFARFIGITSKPVDCLTTNGKSTLPNTFERPKAL